MTQIQETSAGAATRGSDVAVLLVLAAVGLALFVLTFSSTEPSARLGLQIDRYGAWRIADERLAELGYDLGEYTRDNAAFVANNEVIAYLRSRGYDTVAEQKPFVDFRPVGRWDLLYVRPSDGDRFRFKISPDGRIYESERTPPTGSTPGRLSQGPAIRLAKEFLGEQFHIDWAHYEISEARTIQHDDRIDHVFMWQRMPAPADGVNLNVFATVQGQTVGGWGTNLELPEAFSVEYSSKSGRVDLFYFASFILAAGAWLLALFMFALRFRAREIGIRGGLVVAIALLVIAGLYYSNSVSYVRYSAKLSEQATQMILIYIALAINVAFAALGVFIVWISGESIAREVWPEKLKVFDGLFGRRYLFRDLGKAILRGGSLGLLQVGVFYGLAWVFVREGDAWPMISEPIQQALSSFSPFGVALATGLLNAVTATSYAFLFGLSFFQKRLGRTWASVAVMVVLFSFFFLDPTILLDRWYTSIAGVVAGLAAFLYFLRYDLGTVFFGQMFAAAVPTAWVFLSQPSAQFQLAAIVSLSTMVLILAGATLLAFRGTVLDERSVQPRYVQFISERERLKLELEIARRAQLRMLPRSVPDTSGLDIAAFSEPAREVGGDYFDFFRLGPNSLGVAIGDVSGKGMPAALYMTMLKGFLQSQANSGASPREILSSTNRYFHASAESAIFVTLLFCVFDLATSQLTFARAGHYPLLIHRPRENTTTILQPPGIGIGLEEGDVFDRVIREESFGLQQGDVVVMYTDGLTEARNRAREEFGQDRIRTMLQQIDGESAEQILNAIRNTYESFREGEDAHDDFSCVVVRIT